MSTLSDKTADELSELLDEYGIKHGPVVDSTRRLYEKKLKEAMSRGKAAPPSDKTYYREEEEEVTYVYRTPVRNETSGDSSAYMRSRQDFAQKEYDQRTSYASYSRTNPSRDYVDEPRMYDTPSTYKNSYLNTTPMKSGQEPKDQKPPRFVPMWLQICFFVAVVVFLYFVFSNMETNEPLKVIE